MKSGHKYNTAREKILMGYYQLCKSETWCNTKTSEEYKLKSYFTDIPRIVISSLIGSSALVLEYVKNENIKSYALLAVGCLGITNALIGTLQSFFNLAEKSQIHRQNAKSYNSLADKIKLTLSLPRRDRPDAIQFIDEIKNEYNKIQENSLDIPSCIVMSFQRQFKKK